VMFELFHRMDQFQSTITALLGMFIALPFDHILLGCFVLVDSHRRAKRRAQDISKSLTTAESSC